MSAALPEAKVHTLADGKWIIRWRDLERALIRYHTTVARSRFTKVTYKEIPGFLGTPLFSTKLKEIEVDFDAAAKQGLEIGREEFRRRFHEPASRGKTRGEDLLALLTSILQADAKENEKQVLARNLAMNGNLETLREIDAKYDLAISGAKFVRDTSIDVFCIAAAATPLGPTSVNLIRAGLTGLATYQDKGRPDAAWAVDVVVDFAPILVRRVSGEQLNVLSKLILKPAAKGFDALLEGKAAEDALEAALESALAGITDVVLKKTIAKDLMKNFHLKAALPVYYRHLIPIGTKEGGLRRARLTLGLVDKGVQEFGAMIGSTAAGVAHAVADSVKAGNGNPSDVPPVAVSNVQLARRFAQRIISPQASKA